MRPHRKLRFVWLRNGGPRKLSGASEREIVRLVVAGLLNKEIADQLDLALITVKVHRGRAMHKLAAGNPAEMVHIAQLGGLHG